LITELKGEAADTEYYVKIYRYVDRRE